MLTIRLSGTFHKLEGHKVKKQLPLLVKNLFAYSSHKKITSYFFIIHQMSICPCNLSPAMSDSIPTKPIKFLRVISEKILNWPWRSGSELSSGGISHSECFIPFIEKKQKKKPISHC